MFLYVIGAKVYCFIYIPNIFPLFFEIRTICLIKYYLCGRLIAFSPS